jgi:hypothetical protein
VNVVNIINANLENQRQTGAIVAEGFRKHGHKVSNTSSRDAKGDITVVHGPNYALKGRQGLVLWLDRCWYGNPREWVTLGWKASEHTRDFAKGDETRFMGHQDSGVVELEPMRRKGKTIALDDYAQTVKHSPLLWDTYRGHPARQKHTTSLYAAMRGHAFAVCGGGTCAAQAKLAGLHVICLDTHNIVHTRKTRASWAADLAWTQWNMREIASGVAIEHLLACL